jgi:hypothetical protein
VLDVQGDQFRLVDLGTRSDHEVLTMSGSGISLPFTPDAS